MKYFLSSIFTLLLAQSTFAQIGFSNPVVMYTLPDGSYVALDAGSLADFTGDGRLDYLFTITEFGNSELFLLEQNSGGSFSAVELQDDASIIVEVVDVDEDGDQDYLSLSNVYVNDGSNNFLPEESGMFPAITDEQERIFFTAQDLNSDGLVDYATGSNLSVFGDSIFVYFGNADGGFDAVGVKASDPEVTGSFNLAGGFQNIAPSGILAVADSRATIYGVSSDALTEVATISDSRIEEKAAAIGDVDGDGDNDVLLVGTFSGLFLWEQEAGGFAADLTVVDGAAARILSMELLDIDGDGDLDLVTYGGAGNAEVLVYENTGAGQFSSPLTIYTGSSLGGVFFAFGNANENVLEIGDVDGDDDLDIVVFDYTSDQIVLLENNSVPTSIWSPLPKTLSLQAFPNPTQDFVQIEFPESTDLLVWDGVVLHNQQGKVVQNWASLPKRVDLQHLPSGEYILSAITIDQQVFQARLLHFPATR